MPRFFLTLLVCLMALVPQRVCACAAETCCDSRCPVTTAPATACGHDHDGESDEHELGEPHRHTHHESGCPAVTAPPVSVVPGGETVSVDSLVGTLTFLPGEGWNPTSPLTPTRPIAYSPAPPHVPLHVSLQVFQI